MRNYQTKKRHEGNLTVCNQMDEASLKRMHTILVPLYDILEKAKL